MKCIGKVWAQPLEQSGNSVNGVSDGDFSPPGGEQETGPGRESPGACG